MSLDPFPTDDVHQPLLFLLCRWWLIGTGALHPRPPSQQQPHHLQLQHPTSPVTVFAVPAFAPAPTRKQRQRPRTKKCRTFSDPFTGAKSHPDACTSNGRCYRGDHPTSYRCTIGRFETAEGYEDAAFRWECTFRVLFLGPVFLFVSF